MQPPTHGTTVMVMLIILVTFFLFLLTDYADAVRMDMMGWTMKDKPIICTNNLTEYKWATYKAIQLWNDFTILPQWHISSSDGGSCNVYLTEKDELTTGGIAEAWCSNGICRIDLEMGYHTNEVDRIRIERCVRSILVVPGEIGLEFITKRSAPR